MSRPNLRSASGLRPASAFLFVGVVLSLVFAKAFGYGALEDHGQPDRERAFELPAPDFDLVDREGRVLARSVERMDLVMSPRAMWQAHTPDRIARNLCEALGPKCDGPEDLLARMLPDARGGVIAAEGDLFRLDRDRAVRVRNWYVANEVDGFQVVAEAGGETWRVLWDPRVALSKAARARHAGALGPPRPTTWGRMLADDLAECLLPVSRLADARDPEALRDQRERIWRGLMPSADAVVFEGIDPARVDDVVKTLDDEKVAGHQMRVDFRHERTYPVRDETRDEDPFELLGDWRYVDQERARELTALAWNDRPRPTEPNRARVAFEREVRRALDRVHPFRGIELLGARLFQREPWRLLRPSPGRYEFDRLQPALGSGKRYYLRDREEQETPRVVTTIDARLQGYTRQILNEIEAKHDPAVAMAIVVDVASGEVLAVDSVSRTTAAEFLPLYHEYSPGSTFKSIVMATALEEGVVHPEERFDTHDGLFWFEDRNKPIREAEGHQTGWLSARYGLAHSVNAILVQIGTRIPQRTFRATLADLGYGSAPAVGLGRERDGYLKELPWRTPYAHVSMCFGHEIGVTLWQHAAGLATVVRGGVHRPLSIVRAIELRGEEYALERDPGRRVFRTETAAEVRDMMRLGAVEGTGDRLWKQVRENGSPLWFASKTGTTEKEPGVVCLHLEQERNEANRGLQPGDPGWVSFDAIRARPRPHGGSCYVSSICLFGRAPGSDREVLVYVVVDEALEKGRAYGSLIAGPWALKLLHEAVGLTHNGEPTWIEPPLRGADLYARMHNPLERPWDQAAAAGRTGGGANE